MHFMAFFLVSFETDFETKSFLKEKWNQINVICLQLCTIKVAFIKRDYLLLLAHQRLDLLKHTKYRITGQRTAMEVFPFQCCTFKKATAKQLFSGCNKATNAAHKR